MNLALWCQHSQKRRVGIFIQSICVTGLILLLHKLLFIMPLDQSAIASGAPINSSGIKLEEDHESDFHAGK